MDLHYFETDKMYFDTPLPEKVSAMLSTAAELYPEPEAELHLLRACLWAPENLSVLVGLYRFYYFQHRLSEALIVAEKATRCSGQSLGFPDDWRRLNPVYLGRAVVRSIGLVRFYLLALKASATLHARIGDYTEAREMLLKVTELDQADRLGARALLDIVELHGPAAKEFHVVKQPKSMESVL